MLLTIVAMIAFAANSLLCRAALGDGLIDAASFATIRVASGALILLAIVLPHWWNGRREPPDPRAALMLFAYVALFSFAYLSLSAGAGALLLFGAVQLTMFAVALRRGEAFPPWAWFGLMVAVAGIVYLVSPGLTAPDPFGALLMVGAGIAWGIYSLLGRHARDALGATANNFLISVPLVIVVSLAFADDAHLTGPGVVLAIASGALASGLGYVVWYAALSGLRATSAATVQLSVPVIAAIGGVVLLAEPVTPRLVLASLATLGGIAIVLMQRARPA
jgi:drug/metabolite transporter (DMT)-like permease